MKLKYVGNHDVYFAGLGPNENVETWWPDLIEAYLATGVWVEVDSFDEEAPAETESAPVPVEQPAPVPAATPVADLNEGRIVLGQPSVENAAPTLVEHE